MECLNNIPDNEETREPIDSSQLSYAKHRKVHVSGIISHKNRVRMQQGIENKPALKSIPVQCVDNIINI